MGDTLRAGRGCWGGAGLLLLVCSNGLGRAGRKHLRSRGAVLPGWAVREEPSLSAGQRRWWRCGRRGRRAARQNCQPEGEKRARRWHRLDWWGGGSSVRGEMAQKAALTKPPTSKTEPKHGPSARSAGSFPKEQAFFFFPEVEFV